MKNFMTFNTTELLIFLSALPVLIAALIVVKKYLIKKINYKFDFNSGHYLLGLVISLSSSIALLNWETSIEPISYYVEDGLEEPIVQIPRTIHKREVKAVPPPPKPKKVIKKIDLTKLQLVNDDIVLTQKEPLLDEADIPTPPVVAVSAADPPPPTPAPIVEDDGPDFILIPEQMPRFPGCEHKDASMEEKEACSKQELLEYIYKHLKYPALARGSGIEGTIVLQFVVSKQGRIEDLNIVRDIGGGCGTAAAKVVSAMNDMDDPWTAGKQRGRPVKVLYTLPVKFRLN